MITVDTNFILLCPETILKWKVLMNYYDKFKIGRIKSNAQLI